MIKLNKAICFFFLLLTTSFVWTQSKINFSDISISQAVQRAKIENKLVFIDAYASYCGPCKIMDNAFKNPSVVSYFNKNFINIKVDMEGANGPEYKNAFQIVFLPTMVFLNPEGKELSKIDNVISTNELLSIARFREDKFRNHTSPVSIKQTPNTSSSKTSSVVKPSIETKNSNEKILYVLGEDLPPPILREEAYFRMQLMDGSHLEKAKEYLETQTNWSTRENIRFIFDFLHSCKSEMFNHFVENRELYNNFIGKKEVDRSLFILIKKELIRAFPKPTNEEKSKLLSLLDKEASSELMHQIENN